MVNFTLDKDACCLLSGSLQLQGTDLLFLANAKGWTARRLPAAVH